MNRTRFMRELEQLLKDLPDSERREAIQYYNDYFDDAGPENEAKVIQELGSPELVAHTIRTDTCENGEYTEHGYEDPSSNRRQDLSSVPLPESLKKPNLWKAACIILLCLILVPIIVPIFMAVILVLVSILIGILGITVGIVAASIVLPLSGILLIGYGIWRLFLLPGVGLTLGGVGCILLAVGILLFILTVWIIKVLLPLCLRAIISVIRFPLRKAGVVK